MNIEVIGIEVSKEDTDKIKEIIINKLKEGGTK